MRAADRGAGRLNHYPDVSIAAPGGSRANLVPAALLTLAAASAIVLVWSMRRRPLGRFDTAGAIPSLAVADRGQRGTQHLPVRGRYSQLVLPRRTAHPDDPQGAALATDARAQLLDALRRLVRGYWIAGGPHALVYLDGSGEMGWEIFRLAGDALVFTLSHLVDSTVPLRPRQLANSACVPTLLNRRPRRGTAPLPARFVERPPVRAADRGR